MSAQPLLVLGTRTLASEIADLAAQSGFRVAGFVENLEPERCREPLDGLPVHWIDGVAELAASHLSVCGIATTRRSRFVAEAAARGLGFAVVVHPSAVVSPQTALGEGSIVSPGAVIASHTTLGTHVLVNRGVLIGHHTQVGDYATLQPGANVAGACRIGNGAYVGMGAVVLDHLSIGDGAIVGAGAVVTRDVPARAKVLGLPARVVEEDVEAL